MFSVINGDEISATFELLEEDLTGDIAISTFFDLYLYSYVAIFTVLALNLLIALLSSAYEEVKVSTIFSCSSPRFL